MTWFEVKLLCKQLLRIKWYKLWDIAGNKGYS